MYYGHQTRITQALVVLFTALSTTSALAATESLEKKLKKSCDAGQGQDCYALAKAYYTGQDVEQNPKKAAGAY
jgi:TPR repeat protein